MPKTSARVHSSVHSGPGLGEGGTNLPGNELPHDDSHAPDISFLADMVRVGDQLGRHVRQRPAEIPVKSDQMAALSMGGLGTARAPPSPDNERSYKAHGGLGEKG